MNLMNWLNQVFPDEIILLKLEGFIWSKKNQGEIYLEDIKEKIVLPPNTPLFIIKKSFMYGLAGYEYSAGVGIGGETEEDGLYSLSEYGYLSVSFNESLDIIEIEFNKNI